MDPLLDYEFVYVYKLDLMSWILDFQNDILTALNYSTILWKENFELGRKEIAHYSSEPT